MFQNTHHYIHHPAILQPTIPLRFPSCFKGPRNIEQNSSGNQNPKPCDATAGWVCGEPILRKPNKIRHPNNQTEILGTLWRVPYGSCSPNIYTSPYRPIQRSYKLVYSDIPTKLVIFLGAVKTPLTSG